MFKPTAPNSQVPEVQKVPEVNEYAIELPESSLQETVDIETTPTTDQPEPSLNPQPDRSRSRRRSLNPISYLKRLKKWQVALIVFIILIFISLTTLGIYSFGVVKGLQAIGRETEPIAQQAYTHFKEQNLPAVETDLVSLEGQLDLMETKYHQLNYLAFVPVARGYYADGQSALNAARSTLAAGTKSIKAITPYADVLGFAGEDTFTGGTAEDRLKVILETLDKISPELDAITKDLVTVQSELATIDPNDYPETFQGRPVRSLVVSAKEFGDGAVTAVTEFRPVLEELPSVAGARGERKKYLILFQNDNELRPTGGFMTAYAIINIENGKVEPEKSDDIYELDQKFTQRIPIPESLGKYLTTEKYWNLRDMNTDPDFKRSMETFYSYYKDIKGEPESLDGIIAVDTEFLTKLLDVLGPVDVPGYGTFGSQLDKRCDCPQIIYVLSEIITRPTPYLREDRKGIIGPLMRSILTKSYTAPKQEWPALFQAGFSAIESRHLQFYFMDEKAQSAAEVINAAGRIQAPSDGRDFLAIINTNLGGAKSNLFTDYSVEQTVSQPENSQLKKTLTITYKNNRKADNCNLEAGLLCLNSTLRDWTRLYVPQGATLIEAKGFTAEAKTYEENGLTVIDGFFTLEPDSTAKIEVVYFIPYQDQTTYKIDVWKQGGISQFDMLMDTAGGQEQLTINKDTTYETLF